MVAPVVSLVEFLFGARLGIRLGPRKAGGEAGALPAALGFEAGMLVVATAVALLGLGACRTKALSPPPA